MADPTETQITPTQPPRIDPAALEGQDVGATVIEAQRQAAASDATDFLEGFAEVEPEEPDQPPQTEEAEQSTVGAIAGDIGQGVLELPAQVAGGVLDAFEGALTGVAAFDQYASEALGLPKLQVFNDRGEFDLELLSAEEAGEASVSLPEVGEAQSVTGGLTRGISQFVGGFVGGSKFLKGLGALQGASKGAQVARASGAAALSDFAAFDGHEQRLSDLIEQVPWMANPVTSYLASDMSDSELEGRLKNVAEGALSDIALSAVVAGVRAIRHARRAKDGLGGETYTDAAQRLVSDPEVLRDLPPDLGDIALRPDTPAVFGVADAEASDEISAFLRDVDADPIKGSDASPEAIAKGVEEADRLAGQKPRSALSAFKNKGLGGVETAGTPEPVQLPVDLIRDLPGASDEVRAPGDPKFDRLLEKVEREGFDPDQGGDAIEIRVNKEGQPYVHEGNTRLAVAAAQGEANVKATISYRNGGEKAQGPMSPDRVREALGMKPTEANPNISRIRAGDQEVLINWSRINDPEDVKLAIQRTAEQAKREIDDARRGRVSNAETELNADQLDAWQILQERRQGAPMNAEESLAARRLWASSGQRLIELARKARAAPTPANRFAFRRGLAMHQAIQREVIAARTETARALQQWNIPAGSDRELMRHIEETVDQFGGEVSDELAGRILQAADEGNLAAIDQMARRSALAATSDAVTEYWTMSILSGPKTHLVNILSNAIVIGLLQAERVVARGLGAVRGGKDVIEAGEAAAALHGAISSIPEAFRFAARSFRTGQSGFGMQKVELPYRRAISSESLGTTSSKRFNAVMNQPLIARGIDALGAVVSVPGKALGGADEFFKTINFRSELHALAMRQARQEARSGAIPESGIKGRMAELMAEPTENMRMLAREQAQYATFTNDAGRYARMLTDLRHKAPILRFVIPFVNTPANILRFAAERSPIAPMLGDVRADIAAGGVRRDMALTRMGLGSAIMAWAWDSAMNGNITGAGPDNYNAQQALRRQGWQPYSIKVGDRYYAYNRLDPFGMQLGVAAELAEIALNTEEDPGEEYDEAVFRAIGAIGQNMMDKTYLTGVADLVSALSEPKRFAPTYFERLLASFVPTASREIASFQEPEMKRSTDLIERMKERIPVLRGELESRHDLWGRPISYQSGLGGAYDAVSPIYSSREDPEPIDQELVRLNYFPALPSSTVTVNRESFSLRNEPEAYERYVVLQGGTAASSLPPEYKSNGELTASSARLARNGDQTLLEALNSLVTGSHEMSGEYADADNLGREDLIRQTISDYRRAARRKLLEEFPDVFEPGTGRL